MSCSVWAVMTVTNKTLPSLAFLTHCPLRFDQQQGIVMQHTRFVGSAFRWRTERPHLEFVILLSFSPAVGLATVAE